MVCLETHDIQSSQRAKHRLQVKTLISNSLFTHQIKPFVVMGNIFGTLPLQVTSRGAEVKLWSGLTLWCIFVLTISMTFMAFVTKEMFVYVFASKRFDEKMFAQIFIVIMIPYILVPFTLWLDSISVARYYNNWDEFQINLYKTTKDTLDLNIKKKIVPSLIMCILESTLPCLGMMILPPYLTLWQMPMPVLSIQLQTVFLYYRSLNCKAIYRAGEHLAERLKNDIVKNQCSVEKITGCRELWLQISCLCLENGNCVCRTFGLSLILSMWIISSGLYGCISNLMEHDFERTLPFLFITVHSAYRFFGICNWGYLVRNKVEQSIQCELQKINPSAVTKDVWTEVDSFLETVAANPPIVALGGFVNLDRHLCQSAAATIVTYLVVLMQFNMILTDTEFDYQNSTVQT